MSLAFEAAVLSLGVLRQARACLRSRARSCSREASASSTQQRVVVRPWSGHAGVQGLNDRRHPVHHAGRGPRYAMPLPRREHGQHFGFARSPHSMTLGADEASMMEAAATMSRKSAHTTSEMWTGATDWERVSDYAPRHAYSAQERRPTSPLTSRRRSSSTRASCWLCRPRGCDDARV